MIVRENGAIVRCGCLLENETNLLVSMLLFELVFEFVWEQLLDDFIGGGEESSLRKQEVEIQRIKFVHLLLALAVARTYVLDL